jgi:cytochrome P450
MGLPLVGETPAFVRNPYRFLEVRRDRHGDIFKSNVAGHRVVFLSGIDGASAFYDPENIGRDHAHPFLMADMFGGTNFEMYDGPRHLALKTIALGAFDQASLGGYLPDMQLAIETWLERHANGVPFPAMTALRRLAIDAICLNVMGLAPGPETETMTRDYGLLLAGLAASVPVRIPGTTYGRAMKARDRLLARIRTVVQERRARPAAATPTTRRCSRCTTSWWQGSWSTRIWPRWSGVSHRSPASARDAPRRLPGRCPTARCRWRLCRTFPPARRL